MNQRLYFSLLPAAGLVLPAWRLSWKRHPIFQAAPVGSKVLGAPKKRGKSIWPPVVMAILEKNQ